MQCPECKTENCVPTAWSGVSPTRYFCSQCDADFQSDEVLLDEAFSALGTLFEYHEGDPTVEAWLRDIESSLQRTFKRITNERTG